MTCVTSRATRFVPKPPLRNYMAPSLPPASLLLVRLLLHILMLFLVLLMLGFLLAYRSRSKNLVVLGVEGVIRY